MRSTPTLGMVMWSFAAALGGFGSRAEAGIHRAPIVIKGKDVRSVTRYPIELIHIYRTGESGEAIEIPFQIDEVNSIGDYVMNQGPLPNTKTGNGIFDDQDELALMGDDVGPRQAPSRWPSSAPNVVFELKFGFNGQPAGNGPKEGAVYIGIHFDRVPYKVNYKYVVYDPIGASITTSRYRYRFDKRNYLVVEGVDMLSPAGNGTMEPISVPMIKSSTFYLKADLKYFLTFIANHRSVDSKLEAFKVGPVRTIVRVSFFYTFLKLNFEAGMYTEVSFFSNSVILPAMMYNPIDGKKSLNRGSGFYYGFTLNDDPAQYEVKTNMPRFEDSQKNVMNFFKSEPPAEPKYWVSAVKDDRMIYVEISPSEKMRKDKIYPYYYMNTKSPNALARIDNNTPKPLDQSRVNIGLWFDVTRFAEGEHLMAFQLFFENKKDLNQLNSFINLNRWQFSLNRI